MEFNTPLPTLEEFQTAYPNIFTDDAVAVQYLIDHEVFTVPEECGRCGGDMKKKTTYLYQCGSKHCRAGKSVMDGSFFSGSRSIAKLLLAAYLWLSGSEAKQVELMTGFTDKTARLWRKHMQDLLMYDVKATPEDDLLLGGPNWAEPNPTDSIVEIDESKFGKRKNHVGHQVEGVWVVGLIERSRPGYKGKFVVEAVADRTAPTLEALILKYVRPGTCLYSDKWKGYRTMTLLQWEILHRTVNHTYNFKDPVTLVHTNTIEGMWGHMKKVVPRQSRKVGKVDAHLWEFMWRRTYTTQTWNRFIYCLRVIRYDVDGEPVAVAAVAEPEAVVDEVVEAEAEEAAPEVEVPDDYMYGNNLCNIC